MPFANLKVSAGTLLPDTLNTLTNAVTDAIVAAYGEQARADTLVVVDGGWSQGGTTLTASMLGRV